MNNRYFISIVEEYWRGQEPGVYVGRAEITDEESNSIYHDDEIRWIVNSRDRLNKLKDDWDFKKISKEELEELKTELKELSES